MEIFIEDGCVEFGLDEFVFRINLDQRGLPLLAKSLKQQLSPYMSEWLEKMMRKMRSDDACYAYVCLDVEHEDSCHKFTESEICNCNAVVRDLIDEYVIRGWEYGKLTCAVCNTSSSGKLSSCSIAPGVDAAEAGERAWIEGEDRDYWRFIWDGRLMCDDCAEKLYSKSERIGNRKRIE